MLHELVVSLIQFLKENRVKSMGMKKCNLNSTTFLLYTHPLFVTHTCSQGKKIQESKNNFKYGEDKSRKLYQKMWIEC